MAGKKSARTAENDKEESGNTKTVLSDTSSIHNMSNNFKISADISQKVRFRLEC